MTAPAYSQSAGRPSAPSRRVTLADRYAADGPSIGEELRVINGRWTGEIVRVLAVVGRTVVVHHRASTLRQSYGRSELAPIAARILTGR